MQTRATLALSMHMRYIQFWKILCCPCFKSHIQSCCVFFFVSSSCCLSPSPSQEFPLQVANNHYSLMTLGYERKWIQLCVERCVCAGEEGEEVLYQSTTKWLFGHEKQCQGAIWNFNCTTLRKKKKRKSALRMKLRYKLKLEGFCVSVTLCWRPRILLYNGLSTFFITI